MVLVRNAVHAALFLALTMLCLAVLYVAQDAPFLGVVQIIVYTGAIMMLFLFVLMLVGVDSSDSLVETLRGQRVAAFLVGLGFGALLIVTGVGRAVDGHRRVGLEAGQRGRQRRRHRRLLFTDYVFAFEVTSALLITAALGAMVLAHKRARTSRARPSASWPRERFRAGGSRRRCPARACSRGTTPSTPRRCCPTAPPAETSRARECCAAHAADERRAPGTPIDVEPTVAATAAREATR